MLAQLVFEEVLQLRQREWLGAGFQSDESLGRLATVLVVDADHRRFPDRRMLVDRLLEHARIHVESAAKEHVLAAVDDEDKAVFIHVGDVAGAKQPVELGRLRGRVRLVPVALHHVRSLDAHLAALAERQVASRVVEVEHLERDAGQRDAARAGLALALHRAERAGW
jgi:hypothetical protein